MGTVHLDSYRFSMAFTPKYIIHNQKVLNSEKSFKDVAGEVLNSEDLVIVGLTREEFEIEFFIELI